MRSRGPGASHRLDADRVRDEHPPGGAEGELALQPGVLVVLHLHRRNPQQRRDDGEVDRAVGEREVEAPRPRAQRGERRAAPGQRQPLAGGRAAAVAADDLVLEPEPLEHADGLPVLARGDLDLVPAARRRSMIGRRTSGCAAAVQSTQILIASRNLRAVRRV